MISLAPSFTQRNFYWTAWKVMQVNKNLMCQHEEDASTYVIWGYDGPEVILCTIWRGAVPQCVIEAGYSQAQNDADKADFESTFKPISNRAIDGQPPFADKVIGAKKLYKRVHGISAPLSVGVNTIMFSIPYAWTKITGLELIGGEKGDTTSFVVLDTPSGLISTVPNYQLNQFGFDVNVAPDYYEHKSEFDADLYMAMQLKITYNSVSSKTIGVNFILNEVK